ncbi:cation diffusion facilitator family transporter [Paracidovorax avenae]|uniref:cation diffusion facilitator family transporter n=1 Tax=Paracidovorax avenae TaxID=80867 RepID=UPI000D16BB1C|nr:cation diffusion facilitator family transporter [Paracidovorax avenae]AVS83618.1 cation transporter [Paracidovorax avenae]AVS87046.1 cation transporter [Paracidovorax avenae]AVS94876.1 cation transporter [Paracidovorax avenae]AVT01218.1 cation transporter [Paracidovorax avenae]AVT08293.1 cation transporter [Paracidovorax avenae]
MSAGHDHGANAHEGALKKALLLTAGFLLVEVAGGLWSGSLALLSDAAHMFTDAVALGIALLAIRLGRRAADDARTFGYARFEILAAAFNALLLFGVAGYVLYEAYRRFSSPPEVQSLAMLAVATAGLAINFISMRLLAGGREQSLNVKGAYLEVWADLLGSVGVIAGAIVIYFTGWTWVDTAVAVAIGLWVLPRTWTLLSESVNVLLEGVPREVDIQAVSRLLQDYPGVLDVHDLHIWSVSNGKTSLTAHVVYDPRIDPQQALRDLRARLAGEYSIHHSTLQMETQACERGSGAPHFGPASAADGRQKEPAHG